MCRSSRLFPDQTTASLGSVQLHGKTSTKGGQELDNTNVKEALIVGRSGEEEVHVPALILNAGNAAQFAWDEFIYGELRNPHTRRRYGHAVNHFFAWCNEKGCALHQVAPGHVGRYLDELPLATVTKKLHLSAIRRLFDFLVNRHAVFLNPAATVRTERHRVVEGKTPEIPIEQARLLLASIDCSHVIGLRDRAAIGILIYTAVRIGAVAKLRRSDFYNDGDQECLRFLEKGGVSREIPVRHDLKQFILDYIHAAGLEYAEPQSPLFRATVRKTRAITNRQLVSEDIGRMVKRRMRDAGLSPRLSPHSFRVTTITDLLSQGVRLDDVQDLAGHADPRTTQLYDRRKRRVTRNIVERISI